jgi:eukaryotic-like serine/threonine-protein kinase
MKLHWHYELPLFMMGHRAEEKADFRDQVVSRQRGKRRDSRSHLAVPNDSDANPCGLSSSDFLGTVERSGILSETGLQEVRECLVQDGQLQDSSVLAERLVKQGRLTEFQARRLLVGKAKSLVFGRYVLLDRLGIGAMGRVFKARHRLMDRLVALKVVLPVCATSKFSVSRFFREMKIVGLLDHPNVVRAFDADQFEDSPYIVMEYLEGEDLEKVLRRRGMLPPQEVIDCMIQVARGLAHAHEKGVVHRDIKPTNLFLDNTGVVKVLDLGLGAFVGVSNNGVSAYDTDEGFVVGTSDYMSPEQLNGQEVDARTDLFSLGCAMYRLLTGEFAFPGMTKMDRMVKRIQDRHVPITDVRKDLPVPLVAVIDRLLSLRPEDRFSSAAEVAEELEMLLPVADRRKRVTRTCPGSQQLRTPVSLSLPEPETPLDWSLIESALQSKRDRARETALSTRSAALDSPRPTSTRINSHRKNLEDEGVESGRRVQQEYRKEVIQLNRALVEERTQDQTLEPPTVAEHWLERLGEQLGDFLAEPSAGHIILILVTMAIIVALGLAYTLS